MSSLELFGLLDSYYGMQDEAAAAEEARDMSSAAFSPATLASEVLASRSLPELVAYNRKLGEEMRQLDGTMQNLVYNNYNKFINATDTIRAMKDSVADMDGKMARLVHDMREMGGSSETVNASLHENRSKIEKLIGIKRLLVKLEFLFELPLRLRQSIELDAQAQAVKYYTMASSVLKKYDHIHSLHKIRVEADAIIDQLRRDLRAVLKDAKGSTGRVVEAIKLLVQLSEPRPALRAAYLHDQRARLAALLKAQLAHLTPADSDDAAAASSALSAGAVEGGAALLSARAQAWHAVAVAGQPDVRAAVTSDAQPRPRATVPAYLFVQGVNRAVVDAFRMAADLYVELFEATCDASTPAGAAEKRQAHDDLLLFAKELFGQYFSVVRSQLSLLPAAADTAAGQADAAARASAGRPAASGRAEVAAAQRAGLRALGVASAGAGGGAADADAEEEAMIAAAEDARRRALQAAAAMKDGGAGGSDRFGSVSDALKLMLGDVRMAARLVPEACLIDRAQEVTEAVLRAQLENLFAEVRADIVQLLLRQRADTYRLMAEEQAKASAAAAGLAVSVGSSGSTEGGATSARSDAQPALASAASALPYDWIQIVGREMGRAGEAASEDVSDRIDASLAHAKPLLLSGMQLLPELARVFQSLLAGQMVSLLTWVCAACEGLSDAWHPARTEAAPLVVQADLGLDKDLRGGAGGARGGMHGRMASAGMPGGPADAATTVKRRVTVAYGGADRAQPSGGSAHSGAVDVDASCASPAATFLLLLACLCHHFADAGVSRALSNMLRSLPSQADLRIMGVPTQDKEMEAYGSMSDLPDLVKAAQAAARELLRRFVYFHTSRMTVIIRRAMTAADWAHASEPREVRLAMALLLEDAAFVKKLAACALGDWDAAAVLASARAYHVGVASLPEEAASATGLSQSRSALAASGAGNPFAVTPAVEPASLKGGPAAGANLAAVTAAHALRRTGMVVGAAGLSSGFGGAGGGVFGSARGGMSMDIDRLFRAEQAGTSNAAKVILPAVDFSSDSVIKALLRAVFKSLLEWTRALMLNAAGYQQCQVDVAALHLSIPFLVCAPPPPANLAPPSATAAAVSFDPYAGCALLEELLGEVTATAAERCDEPKPLEAAIVYKLAAERVKCINVFV